MSKIDFVRGLSDEVILEKYNETGGSLSATVRAFGCASNNKKAREYVREVLVKYSVVRGNVFDRIIQHSDIHNIITSSASMREILDRLGIADIRTNRHNLRNAVAHLGLQLPDWKALKTHLSSHSLWSRDKIIFKVFLPDEYMPANTTLKAQYLGYLADNDVDKICNACTIGTTWNGLPLVLQLDHIDGDKRNNLLENLRLICPNCHSQTKTFCGRNKTR